MVFPEAGINWLKKEIESLHTRPQDPFQVRAEDIDYFREIIEPFWRGKTLEDDIYKSHGEEISAIEKVVKINQKDHAQGHICPRVEDWLQIWSCRSPEKSTGDAWSCEGRTEAFL